MLKHCQFSSDKPLKELKLDSQQNSCWQPLDIQANKLFDEQIKLLQIAMNVYLSFEFNPGMDKW